MHYLCFSIRVASLDKVSEHLKRFFRSLLKTERFRWPEEKSAGMFVQTIVVRVQYGRIVKAKEISVVTIIF